MCTCTLVSIVLLEIDNFIVRLIIEEKLLGNCVLYILLVVCVLLDIREKKKIFVVGLRFLNIYFYSAEIIVSLRANEFSRYFLL